MRGITFSLLVAALSFACDPDAAPPAGTLPNEACADSRDGVWCSDEVALECRAGQLESEEDCRASDRMCVAGRGCVTCVPGTRACDGQQILICAADGSGYTQGELCPEGSSCSERGCLNLCEEARRERSYIGCEYFPVFTSNSLLDPRFRPAVVIANPNLVPAEVTVSGGERSWPALSVAPQGVETVLLDYVEALQRPSGSAVVRGGAYHLTASVPVTVHQFNPLLFEVDQDCIGAEGDSPLRVVGDGKCNSFSNDASLLLPAHVLRRPAEERLAYLALARPTFMVRGGDDEPFRVSPGFVAVVAVGADPVHVSVTSSALTLGSVADADDAVPPLVPGDSLPPLTLMPGDVLQLLSAHPSECPEPLVEASGAFSCPLGPEYDLTGTRVEADGPIAMIAGHNCSYVPLDRQACDHLEETMFPLDTWGVEAVAARPRGGVPQPQVVRVLSAADDNLVRFVPEVRAPVRLARGEQLEFETTEHLVVRGDKPIAVAQFLVGQGSQGRVGDPSMSLAIPSEQYRTRYAFLSPATYDANYVSIIAQVGDHVILDGAEVQSFDAIPGSSFQVASVQLRRAGAHEVHSAFGSVIGVQLYGYGDFTSYMLPGGLDLRVLGPLF
jgi:IgGFc binding protein